MDKNKQAILFITTFNKKNLYYPSLKRLIDSIEKDENVVKPPRKPIMINILISIGTITF
jgi:hypothetical protein